MKTSISQLEFQKPFNSSIEVQFQILKMYPLLSVQLILITFIHPSPQSSFRLRPLTKQFLDVLLLSSHQTIIDLLSVSRVLTFAEILCKLIDFYIWLLTFSTKSIRSIHIIKNIKSIFMNNVSKVIHVQLFLWYYVCTSLG